MFQLQCAVNWQITAETKQRFLVSSSILNVSVLNGRLQLWN